LNQKILIIGAVFPEPNSTAAGSRMLQIVEQFQNKNWQINFASTASESEFSFDFKSLAINSFQIKMNDSGFDDLIKKINPTIVVFDRFMIEEQFGWRVAENCPDCLRVLDTEDLHFLRKTRHNNLKKNIEFTDNDLLNSDLAKREIASIYRCDLSLIISSFEMNLLSSVFKIDKKILCYLPFLLKKIAKDGFKTFPSLAERQHFISIGNFRHEPNWDAVLYLKNNIWRHIKKQLPDAEIHIYGSYVTEKAQQLHNPKEGFIIKGRADNAHAVIKNARVLLAPLRFGAGLKGKLIDAMQTGTPFVTSEIGAEGMFCDFANSENEFVEKSISIYKDETLWKTAQQNGVEIINNYFEKSIFETEFFETIIGVQNNLEQHRTDNFIGNLLQHHTMQSTKYMSRWIESKQTPSPSGRVGVGLYP